MRLFASLFLALLLAVSVRAQTTNVVELVPDGLAPSAAAFGQVLSASDDRILVGVPATGDVVSPGDASAFIFERRDGGWEQTAKLVPDQFSVRFGASVALDGDRAVVGAPHDGSNARSDRA